MRICFLGANDWANECHRIARSLRRAGWEAHAVIRDAHPFSYVEDGPPEGERAALVRSADWIVTCGDGDYGTFDAMLAKYGPPKASCRFAARHCGTQYRTSPDAYDAEDARRGFSPRVFVGDLWRSLRDKSQFHPFLNPQDDLLSEPGRTEFPLRVLHAPSQPHRKGTDVVDGVLTNFPGIRYEKVTGSPHAVVRAAMLDSDVFVDTLNAAEGNFGAAAAEALAHGLVVVSDLRHYPSAVTEWFEFPPVLDVRGPDDLRETVAALAQDAARVDGQKALGLRWATRWLSPEGTARLWRRLLA